MRVGNWRAGYFNVNVKILSLGLILRRLCDSVVLG